MVSIEEAGAMLDEMAMELPQEFYRELNGGIMLLPEARLHEEDRAGDLFTLGEYHVDLQLGRYIAIYYGSFARVYGDSPKAVWEEELRETLQHEFAHHLESLAGERGLEIKDAQKMAEYMRRHGRTK